MNILDTLGFFLYGMMNSFDFGVVYLVCSVNMRIYIIYFFLIVYLSLCK